MTERAKAHSVLAMNTLAFAVCFAAWMMNGVLITFLVENGLYQWNKAQLGWLIGIPVLTGSVIRLPVGVLTDKYGGRIVYGILMLVSALAMYLMSFADSFAGFVLGSLGFGLAGASFAVGIAYSSVWYPKEQQGTALGIFGAGNAGAAVTSMGAPFVLRWLTGHGEHLENWRMLPKLYAISLVVMTVIFFLFTHSKKIEHNLEHSLLERLAPLKEIRVWRFGLYYFFVFGGFVALAQWLIPYYVNVYGMAVTTAGLIATFFTLPSGVIRALGGWMSDAWGARRVMYWVYSSCLVASLLLIFSQINVWVFTGLVFVIGIMTGLGKAAVYKHIPAYFPHEVGVVGGLVGLIGGLGGFFLPLLFGTLVELTGLWTSCWVFFSLLIASSLAWMHHVVQKMMRQSEPKQKLRIAHG